MQKISKASSVELVEYMKIYRYSKIMHICSQIQGDIKTGLDACDAIESILPAGTLSGAPRVRACQIINELEKEARGIYGGALGYLDFNGDMDTCIAIRMATKKGGKVTVQAGAGIVEHSVAQKEYEETENKALAVINAVCNAFEFDK
jgi:anthranilate synthase component 1